MAATPWLEVCAGSGVAAFVASSAPATVTVAPAMTAPLGSTIVTFSVPRAAWGSAGRAESPMVIDATNIQREMQRILNWPPRIVSRPCGR